METELRFVRIYAMGIEYGNPIYFDVLISSDDKIIPDVEFGGHEVLAEEEQEKIHPFILKANGKFDFGSSYKGESRFAVTNIREVEIIIGGRFNSSYKSRHVNTEECFEIEKLDFAKDFT